MTTQNESSSVTEMVDEREAANILGLKVSTMSVWRSTGRYNLPFVKVGRSVRYRRTDLAEWLEKRTHQNGCTSQ